MLLHMAFHVTAKRHVFCFACTGDTEVYVYDSAAGHWRYLIELIGALNAPHVTHLICCPSLIEAQSYRLRAAYIQQQHMKLSRCVSRCVVVPAVSI